MKRFLILFLLLAPITPAQSTNGTNCRTGSYVTAQSDAGPAFPTIPNLTNLYVVPITSTVTAAE